MSSTVGTPALTRAMSAEIKKKKKKEEKGVRFYRGRTETPKNHVHD